MSKQLESLASLGNVDEKHAVIPAISYQNLDAEKVLHRLGKYGTYQMIIYGMSSLGVLLFVMETMIMSLIAKEVSFTCLSNDPNFQVVDKCTVRNLRSNLTSTCGKVPLTQFVFNVSANNSLTKEFELICDQAYYASHATSIFMLASQLATPIVSFLSDRYGRRWTFLLPLWITVIANLCCSIAPTYAIFLVCRFFAGLGTGGMATVGFVIQIEAVTASFRSVSPLFMTFVWVGGYMLVGVLYMIIPNWRWMYFAISAPGLVTFAFYWLMPESIHWLISNNRSKEVGRYIKQSCRINKREIKLHECRSGTRLDNTPKMSTKQVFASIIKSGPLVFNLLIHCYIMTVMNGTYWVLSLFSVELHENEMVGYFLSGLVEFPAGIISIALLWYFGRRFLTCASLLATAGCMFCAVLYPGKSWISMSFPLLAKVFNSIAWAAEPLLAGELSPTIVRNMFLGFTGFAGETGSLLAPYTNALKEIHELAPSFVICVMSVVAAFAVLCSPETKDKPLPESIDDFDAGPFYRWVCGGKKETSARKASMQKTNRSDEQTTNPTSPHNKDESETLLEA